jgi:hypothetical protein
MGIPGLSGILAHRHELAADKRKGVRGRDEPFLAPQVHDFKREVYDSRFTKMLHTS